MFVLLPPSEGKADSGGGAPLDTSTLSFPALNPTRERVLGALLRLCAGSPRRALQVLGLTPGLAAELERDRALRTGGTLPAAEVYTGVLYEALRPATLDPPARDRAASRLLVVSALWGALHLDDRIPPYRLSMGVRLPRLGPLAACWRGPLGDVLPGATLGHLIVDLRSSPYLAAWRPGPGVAERTVTVRVLKADTRTVVSHLNKATKGRIARHLVLSADAPSTPKELAVHLGDAGYQVELAEPAAAGRPWTLDVGVGAP